MLFRIMSAWICNLIDTIATMYFYLVYGGIELNPISSELLKCPSLFIIFKIMIMTISVIFIWWKRDWWFCKVASWVLFIEYLLVAIYYLVITILLHN